MKEKEQYSYSKLSTWEDCKASYNLIYNVVPKNEQLDSFYGVLGSGCHKIMEDIDNGKVINPLNEFHQVWERSMAYPAHPDNETSGFISNAYYKKLVKFFENIPVQSTPLYKAEQEILIPVGDFLLKGYIDRVGSNGKILLDYKTNNPTSEFWDMEKKLRQLYLYSGWVYKTFGYFPDKLIFWFIRYHGDKKRQYHIETFNIEKFKKAIQWTKDTVKQIREHKGMYKSKTPKEIKNSLFCQVICGVREHCSMRNKEINDKLATLQA